MGVHQVVLLGSIILSSILCSVRCQDIGDLRGIFQNNLRGQRDVIRKLIRMGFHDCVGGCDGCIDLTNPSNNGLQAAVDEAKLWRDNHAPSWSQADVNVLASIVATEMYANKSTGDGVYIEFTTGRVDCNPNKMPSRNFPDAANPDGVGFLKAEFGLTDKEAVALLGAHSVGNVHSDNSGYGDATGMKWDVSPDSLDKKYYTQLLADFHVELLDNPLLPGGKSSQWIDNTGSKVMIHPDMGLLKQFTTANNGYRLPSCQPSANCPDASTAVYVNQFANDQNDFYEHFERAFTKMINYGL